MLGYVHIVWKDFHEVSNLFTGIGRFCLYTEESQ